MCILLATSLSERGCLDCSSSPYSLNTNNSEETYWSLGILYMYLSFFLSLNTTSLAEVLYISLVEIQLQKNVCCQIQTVAHRGLHQQITFFSVQRFHLRVLKLSSLLISLSPRTVFNSVQTFFIDVGIRTHIHSTQSITIPCCIQGQILLNFMCHRKAFSGLSSLLFQNASFLLMYVTINNPVLNTLVSYIECVKSESYCGTARDFPHGYIFFKVYCKLILIIGIIKSVPNRILITSLDTRLYS